MDFSKSDCYQRKDSSTIGLIEFFFKQFIIECKNKGLNTFDNQIEKYFKSNNFIVSEFIHIDKFPIPIFDSQTNSDKLMDFVLKLPQTIYERNSNKIKGVLIFIDEFQIIKELDNYLDSFLWKLRSYIQDQRHVAYVFSGSMGLSDNLISEIASRQGVFGGRMISFNLYPFEKECVRKYLSQRAPYLSFKDDIAFDRFYKCTSGILFYVNIFASLLPRDASLDENMVINNFDEKIAMISVHLINIWNRLTYREQTIIIALLDKPLKRIEIASKLGISTGSLSNSLNKLQKLDLIDFDNGLYCISEQILTRWLNLEFKNNGSFPYRL